MFHMTIHLKLNLCGILEKICLDKIGLKDKWATLTLHRLDSTDKYMLSERELIDTENISLLSQNMKFVGEWAQQTSHKLHILSSRLIFF